MTEAIRSEVLWHSGFRSREIYRAASGAARRGYSILAHPGLRSRGRFPFIPRPYYLEAVPGFEIRVHMSDLRRANDALEWVESKENVSEIRAGFSADDHDPIDIKQSLPYSWDANEASSEVWSGEDEAMAEYLASVLRENGIPSRIPNELGNRARLCVRPGDVRRAQEIAREVNGATRHRPR